MSRALGRRLPRRRNLLQASTFLVLAIGCGGTPPTQPPPPPPTPPSIARVVVTATRDSIAIGQMSFFQAIAEDASGAPLPGTATFTSSNTGVASITPAGSLTGAASGTAVVTATIGGATGQRTIWVGPSLSLGPLLPSLFVGDTLHLTLAMIGAAPGETATVTSRNATVAAVTPGGIVTGTGAGLVQMIATAGATVDSIAVAVIPRPTRTAQGIVAGCGLQHLCLFTHSEVLPLTPESESTNTGQIAWSPDGQRLAVAYSTSIGVRRGIWESAPDGSGAVPVVAGGSKPSWSPDGTLTTYVRDAVTVFVADGNWAAPFRVSTTGLQEDLPQFFPDGREVATRRDGRFYVFPTEILRLPREVSVPGMAGDYTISPDGRWMAIGSVGSAAGGGVEWIGVWLVRRDGTDVRPLSAHCSSTGTCASGVLNTLPSWSPDGRHVVMRRAPNGTTYSHLEVRTAPEGELVAIHPGEGAGWSPDGSRLAFILSGSLYTSLPDFTDIQLVGTGASGMPVWRPGPAALAGQSHPGASPGSRGRPGGGER